MVTAPPNSPLPPTDPRPLTRLRGVPYFRGRILAGLLLVLPFVITAWIVLSLYRFVEHYAIGPIAKLVVVAMERRLDATLPLWFVHYVAPIIAIVVVLVMLYFLGLFAKARVDRILDAVLLRVPIITSIHKAVRQLFAAISGSGEMTRFQRVVLVPFPHPGMKVPGFVTDTCLDVATQKKILCIYVPTTPVPTSGYMLLVPEDEVTELDWSLEETIQAVVSFGLTAPQQVRYYQAPPGEPTSDKPLTDDHSSASSPEFL